jgi:hypothetical protein
VKITGQEILWEDDEKFAHATAALSEGFCPDCKTQLSPCKHPAPADPRLDSLGDCMRCFTCFGGLPRGVDVSDLRDSPGRPG